MKTLKTLLFLTCITLASCNTVELNDNDSVIVSSAEGGYSDGMIKYNLKGNSFSFNVYSKSHWTIGQVIILKPDTCEK